MSFPSALTRTALKQVRRAFRQGRKGSFQVTNGQISPSVKLFVKVYWGAYWQHVKVRTSAKSIRRELGEIGRSRAATKNLSFSTQAFGVPIPTTQFLEIAAIAELKGLSLDVCRCL
jgi:hypothetical protein